MDFLLLNTIKNTLHTIYLMLYINFRNIVLTFVSNLIGINWTPKIVTLNSFSEGASAFRV